MGIEKHMSQRERVLAVLSGKKPDRIPFIDRMNIWYDAKRRTDSIPDRFRGLTLNEVHGKVGLGHLAFASPYSQRLCGVEMVVSIDDEHVFSEKDPLFEFFPGGWTPAFVAGDKAGVTHIEFKTPVGSVSISWGLTESMIPTAVDHYLKEHLIKSADDIETAEYILDRIEFVPRFEEFYAQDAKLGENGMLIGWTQRVPFQQLLLEYFGEVPLFFALSDMKEPVERLLKKLEDIFADTLHRLADFDVPYIEFPDNLDGTMTNPKLFDQYSLPAYQRFTDILHKQGKKVGCHTDGDLANLLGRLKETGIDVCESVSPLPLTKTSFDEFWEAWGNDGPIMWGPIPSPLLEEMHTEDKLQDYLRHLLETVGDSPIILGVSDMVVGENIIERVEYIAEVIEAFDLSWQGKSDATQAPSTGALEADDSSTDDDGVDADSHDDREATEATGRQAEILDDLYDHTIDGNEGEIPDLVNESLELGMNPREILFQSLVPALSEVGEMFEDGRYFVPDMLLSARAMGRAMDMLRPVIALSGGLNLGKVLVGTVRGDIHDIGKNLCCTMLEGAGFDVIDLGVNVDPEAFVEAIREHRPQVVGMSALLTTTAPMIGKTIAVIEKAGLRDRAKILVGGAAVSQESCAYYGADGYAIDAVSAVRKTKEVLGHS